MSASADPLVAMLGELVGLCDGPAKERASQLLDRFEAGDLRVALVGEAKRGKSTFGNAMLGQDVLPAGVVPVTSIGTEVCAGSPRRAEIFFQDGMFEADVCQLDRFVSERLNPRNRRKVTGVRVHLPDGVPHPRMVLIDTPGVGSVHQHNTQAAQEAFTTMDAAVLVLTADPPISGTELDLLREVNRLAVRVFVVLNKADQLEPEELGDAAAFVSDVVTGVLDERPTLWVCSARQGLRARLAGDQEGWRASGMADFMESLLAHLVDHREEDLRASIAASARRIAVQQLDSVALTVAALEAVDEDQQGRLEEFALRLDAVDQRGKEALEFITAFLRRERRRLDEDAATEVARAGARVRERLETWLASAEGVPPVVLEREGREVIAHATRVTVESWRAQWHARCREAYAQLVDREQRLLEEASGDLRSAAEEVMGVRLASEPPALVSPEMSDLHYDFEPEVGWNHALVSGVRAHAPRRIGRRRVSNFLREEGPRLVDKHLGRARADFQRLLEDADRRFSTQVADAFAELTQGLRCGHRSAVELRRRDEFGHRTEQQRLAVRQRALAELAKSLGEVASQPSTAVQPAAEEGAPGTGPRHGYIEESRM